MHEDMHKSRPGAGVDVGSMLRGFAVHVLCKIEAVVLPRLKVLVRLRLQFQADCKYQGDSQNVVARIVSVAAGRTIAISWSSLA